MLNVQVPFLFKFAVDYLNTDPAAMVHASSVMVTMATALLLGCECSHVHIQYMYSLCSKHSSFPGGGCSTITKHDFETFGHGNRFNGNDHF